MINNLKDETQRFNKALTLETIDRNIESTQKFMKPHRKEPILPPVSTALQLIDLYVNNATMLFKLQLIQCSTKAVDKYI
jgi:hypothetical protein